jgi:hypothetical protein
MAMRVHWLLPDEEQLALSGPDWFLLLLNGCSSIQRNRIKLLLWRTWMVRNNTTHQSRPIGILESVKFLLPMESSLNDAEVGTGQEAVKKKQPAEVI